MSAESKLKNRVKSLKKNVRYESLSPAKNPKVRRELLDMDYLHKLKPDELKWLAQFTDEYVGGAIQKSNGKVTKGHIHKSIDLAKSCYDANNRRNSDIFSVGKANNFVHTIEGKLDEKQDGWYVINPKLVEDALIAQIEEKRTNPILSFKEYITLRPKMVEEIRKQYDDYFGDEPYAYVIYQVYENAKLNDYQLNKLLEDKSYDLLKKLVKNPKLFKRKKYNTNRT